jgi:hypothetical protein
MPDETVAPGTGTSDEGGAAASGDNGFDVNAAYQKLRPAYTQATQRLSEYERLFADLHNPDPAIQAEAAEFLGIQFAEDTGTPTPSGDGADEGEWHDPLEDQVAELTNMVQELRKASEQEATAKAEAETLDLRDEFVAQSIDAIASEVQRKFTEQQETVLGNLAIAMADDDDVPDVNGAYALIYGDQGLVSAELRAVYESKTGAQQPPLGTTIPAENRPKTAQERIDYIDKRARDMADQA